MGVMDVTAMRFESLIRVNSGKGRKVSETLGLERHLLDSTWKKGLFLIKNCCRKGEKVSMRKRRCIQPLVTIQNDDLLFHTRYHVQ